MTIIKNADLFAHASENKVFWYGECKIDSRRQIPHAGELCQYTVDRTQTDWCTKIVLRPNMQLSCPPSGSITIEKA